MKHNTRLIAVFLSLVVLLATFAGCQITPQNTPSTPSVGDVQTGQTISGTQTFAPADNGSTIADSKASTTQSGAPASTLGSTGASKTEATGRQTDKQTNQQTTTQKPTSQATDISQVSGKVQWSQIPAYSGKAFVVLNQNKPNFIAKELTTKGYEQYSALDTYGRCQTALASCGKELMPGPDEERGSISSVKPSGWVQAKYATVPGSYLWNRCHLIGWQLSAENANKKNLITGSRYMNTEGMLPFENMVADYIKETGNHVAYRISPIYQGNDLVCRGVQMEAYSIEDQGDGICFHVFCYNVQPGIQIDYATGKSNLAGDAVATTTAKPTTKTTVKTTVGATAAVDPAETLPVYIPKSGSKYHSRPNCGNMKNPSQVTLAEAKRLGHSTPCANCH